MDFLKPRKGAAFTLNRLTSIILFTFLPADEICADARSDILPAGSAREVMEFDADLLIGEESKKTDLSRFSSKNGTAPGRYIADIYFNDKYFSRQTVNFVAVNHEEVQPCLTAQMLEDAGLRFKEKIAAGADGCLFPGRDIPSGRAQFDVSTQKLTVLFPQVLLEKRNKGVPEEQLSAGESALFANYDANYYYSHTKANPSHSGYLYLNSGLNLGLWRLRAQSNATWYKSEKQEQKVEWQNFRTYLQRPLGSLSSQLTLGETYTASNGFSGTGFRGIKLESDERMTPDRERGYAPVIRGVAATTAKVTLRQRGQVIHQTTVFPGAFAIDDLPPTSLQGDIDVNVEEADGRFSSFTVPFAAVPDSLRPGYSQFSFVAGRTANSYTSNALFTDLVWRRGISNPLTYNSGLRLSRGYLSLLSGLVYNNPFGAFGLNSTWSTASVNQDRTRGWRLGSTWSRTFNATGTTVALAGYRYSTQGYRELNDVLGLRDAAKDNQRWQSDSYQQSSQLTLTLNQNLSGYGNLWLSGSQSRYHKSHDRNMNFHLGYSNAWKWINYDISLSRQYQGSRQYGLVANERRSRMKAENSIMFSFSFPFTSAAHAPSFSTSLSHTSSQPDNNSLRSTISGSADEERRSAYNLSVDGDFKGNVDGISGSYMRNFSVVTANANFSKNPHFLQSGISLRGSVIAHRNDVTFGPYLSDTFALVEAKGAEGAKIANGMGATINRSGYAIYPSVTPYRYTDIAIDAAHLADPHTELVENQKKVAGYAGAMLKVSFRTRKGYPLLIKLSDGQKLPLGEDILDEKNAIVGLVGQGNQIYARVAQKQGYLHVKSHSDCQVPYDIRPQSASQPLYRLSASCETVNSGK